jgi:hypothetical protein
MELIRRELRILEALQLGFRASGNHLIPDMVLMGFVSEVVESAHAVIALLAANLGHRAFPNARTAFEAMQQLLLLVTDADYDLAGAKAWIFFSRRDFALLDSHGDSADLPTDPEEYPDKKGLDLALAEITKIWDRYSPGKGRMIAQAAEILAAQPRRPDNWAGVPIAPELQRRFLALASRMGTTPLVSDHARTYNATYSILTRESHPRTRFQPDRMMGHVNGPITFEYEPKEAEAADNVTAIAAGAIAQTVVAMRIRSSITDA